MKDVALLLLAVVAISAAGSYLSGFFGAMLDDLLQRKVGR